MFHLSLVPPNKKDPCPDVVSLYTEKPQPLLSILPTATYTLASLLSFHFKSNMVKTASEIEELSEEFVGRVILSVPLSTVNVNPSAVTPEEIAAAAAVPF